MLRPKPLLRYSTHIAAKVIITQWPLVWRDRKVVGLWESKQCAHISSLQHVAAIDHLATDRRHVDEDILALAKISAALCC